MEGIGRIALDVPVFFVHYSCFLQVILRRLVLVVLFLAYSGGGIDGLLRYPAHNGFLEFHSANDNFLILKSTQSHQN